MTSAPDGLALVIVGVNIGTAIGVLAFPWLGPKRPALGRMGQDWCDRQGVKR